MRCDWSGSEQQPDWAGDKGRGGTMNIDLDVTEQKYIRTFQQFRFYSWMCLVVDAAKPKPDT